MRLRLWMKLSFLVFLGLGAFGFYLLLDGRYTEAAAVMLIWGVETFLIWNKLRPLDSVTQILENVAEGDVHQKRIPERGDYEIERLARATNRMLGRLRKKDEHMEDLAERAQELAAGRIGVVDVEENVLKSGRLADAEISDRDAESDLERSFIHLTNQMRRLTIQARVISQDHLYSPLLDERVPGELGDSFALMVRNLRALSDRATEIARGDLTSHVEGDGDLTSAFNDMVDGLKGLVEQITQTALHISSSAEEILAVLREQELSASHQASGVEETQRTMETLLSSAKKIAESAQTVFKSAEKTQANNRTVADRIGELKSHTERISEILEVIKSIADRSDLLALNASLEGMRAGEAGKGFTLVAAEMRRLAENIKDSVSDIKELLSDIRESALSSVMATEEGTNLSEKTTESALKITLITQQQQSGTEQVTQSMDELSTLINQGVGGTRQVTTAASELVSMAEDMRDLVEEFRISASPSSSSEYSALRDMRSRKISRSLARATPEEPEESRDGTRARRTAKEDAIQAPERQSVKTPVHMGADSSEDSLRETQVLMSTDGDLDGADPIGEDPPTVEFAGMSEEDEQSLLDEIAARKSDASKKSVGSQIDALENKLEQSEAEDVGETREEDTPDELDEEQES